jgi:ABC-type bacteriocin/lantibiotic exporter with double-glycine peptidase domain
MKSSLQKLFDHHSASYDAEGFLKLVEIDSEGFFEKVNDLFNDPLISYHLDRSIVSDISQLADSFVLMDHEYLFIQVIDGKYISEGNRILTIDELRGKKIVTLTEYPRKHNARSFLEVIYSFFPRKSFLSVLLAPFVILSAFYTNLFNTRLIFNDEVHTFLFITSVFFLVHLIDYWLKIVIKLSVIDVLEERSKKIERYFMLVLPYLKSNKLISKIKSIESSKKLIWESFSSVIVEVVVFFFVLTLLFLMVGSSVLVLLLFYLSVFVVFVIKRYKIYKVYIENEAVQQDLLLERISYYKTNSQFSFLDSSFYLSGFERVFDKAGGLERKISIFNYKWDELVKISSFLSSFALFLVLFFESKNSADVFNILIALLLLNGRVSSAVVAIVNRGFHILSSTHHIKQSVEKLFEEIEDYAFQPGFTLETIDSISLVDFSLSASSKSLLTNVNVQFKRGVVYGISGGVGVGKSTLIKAIARSHSEFGGDILFNEHYKIGSIDKSIFFKKVAFLDMNSDFISGSLYYNFSIRGHQNVNYIVSIIKRVLKNVLIDHDFIFKTNVFDIPMSTGQKRILLIAMTLSPQKNVYIFDEVFSNMAQQDLMSLISDVKRQAGSPIIFIVSHDRNVLSVTDVMFEISGGKLLKASDSVIKVVTPTAIDPSASRS